MEISVIIPAYNAESTLLETIESVLQQTFTDFEILVINDGSQDRTQTLAEGITDPRVQVFTYPNGGVCAARNRGIALAKGKYIAFLDADDLWTRDKLELQWAALQENPKAGVAYSSTCLMNMNSHQELPTFHPTLKAEWGGNLYEKLLVQNFIHSGSNPLIRREAIASVGEFDMACASSADWDYWLRLAKHWPFVAVPKYQILYRRSPGSMSSDVERIKRESLLTMDKAYQATPPELKLLKKQTLTNFHKYFAELYLEQINDAQAVKKAQKHLQEALFIEPQIFWNRSTQRLAIRCLIKQIFPQSLANYLLNSIRKSLTISDPRLKSSS
nr:glycosyltransferase family 2 protein [Laspinema sp. D2d]